MLLFSDPSLGIDSLGMRRAYQLAERGRGLTAPNPFVGCVVIRDDQIVGEGFHERAGEAHAEVRALADAGHSARGSHVFVTLEPCSHHGRTPPCADALIAAGVARVSIGMPDPNPIAGGGAARLRDAGIDVEFASDPAPYQDQLREWTTWVRRGRPWVRVKVALSLDGKPGTVAGVRSSITGAGGLETTMRLRSASDAVLVGASTALIDDPRLTVRPEGGSQRQPLRVVLSRSSCPKDLKLFSDGSGRVLCLSASGNGDEWTVPTGVEVEHYSSAEGLRGALHVLGERGITSVLVEAGPSLFSAFWRENLIDELILYHAGGVAGMTAPLLMQQVGSAGDLDRRMKAVEAGVSGEDAITVWRPRVAEKY